MKNIFNQKSYSVLCILIILMTSCVPVMQIADTNPIVYSNPSITHTPINTDYADFKKIFTKIDCRDFKSYIWHYMYQIIQHKNGKTLPYYTMKQNVVKKITALTQDNPRPPELVNQFAVYFVEMYALITEFMEKNDQEKTTKFLLQFENKIITAENSVFLTALNTSFTNLQTVGLQINKQCNTITNTILTPKNTNTLHYIPEDIPFFTSLKNTLHPLVYGAKKVMSVAYQNCSVINLPLLTPQDTTQGIIQTAQHSNGQGTVRSIANLPLFLQSHYYIRHIPQSNSDQCFNIHNKPLIYDYGGKPDTNKNSINLFKNSGSGSQTLGIDCSGFVTSAMASAGLKLKPKVPISAIHIQGINSMMLKKAHNNNLFCLHEQKISVHNPLRPGDIVASDSHVFIIENIGENPLSIEHITNPAQCDIQNIDSKNFNFNVIQSSAHNNGIGINRIHIKNLHHSEPIIHGLKLVASKSCYSRFNQNIPINTDTISILRHDSKNPHCLDQEIYLEKQNCLKSCNNFSI